MGYRGREIETKLLVSNASLNGVCSVLGEALSSEGPTVRFGSSIDTYWHLPWLKDKAGFLRVRERDGIRQITLKLKDRGENTNRVEIDLDCISDTGKIHRLFKYMLGKPAGVIAKTYHVWELESEYDTVCAYQVTTPDFSPVVVEVEAKSEERMAELDDLVHQALCTSYQSYEVAYAPGSLYEMFILKSVKL